MMSVWHLHQVHHASFHLFAYRASCAHRVLLAVPRCRQKKQAPHTARVRMRLSRANAGDSVAEEKGFMKGIMPKLLTKQHLGGSGAEGRGRKNMQNPRTRLLASARCWVELGSCSALAE